MTWHVDFVMGLPRVGDGGAHRLLNGILTVVDRFSGMFWALPVANTITARETGELIFRRICLEDARGLCINFNCDRDQRSWEKPSATCTLWQA